MSTVMTWQTVSTSSEDTEKLGELLGRLIKTPAVIELRSDLGGGKTTFARGLALGFGSSDRVASPTFTLNKIYKSPKGEIHHFDFYRLHEAGLMADQLSESQNNDRVITVVEWGDIVQDVLPKSHLSVEFMPVATDSEERQVVFSYDDSQTGLIRELETTWARGRL